MRQASEREVRENDVGEAARARRVLGRDAQFDALSIEALRRRTRDRQPDLAALLSVELSKFRNWEQGRRASTAPARALLRAIRNDSQNVTRAPAAGA